jgi:hypothetical protein
MKFEIAGKTVEWNDGTLTSDDPLLLAGIEDEIAANVPCGCFFWGEIEPSLATEWQAFLTVGGILRRFFDADPVVDKVPDNPDGYEEEGVWPLADPVMFPDLDFDAMAEAEIAASA